MTSPIKQWTKYPEGSPQNPSTDTPTHLRDPLRSRSTKYYLYLLKQMLLGGIPTIFCLELNIISQMINVYFIGNLNDPKMLGSLGVALLWVNCLSYTIFISLNTGLVTLSAQAFGKKDYQLTGLYFQRGCVINLVFLFFSLLILLFSRPILKLFGFDEVIVDHSMEYIHYSIPSFFFYAYYDIGKNFLQIQKIFNVQAVIQSISAILQFIVAYIMIDIYGLNLKGAGLSRSFSDCLNFVMIYAYIYYRNPTPETWFPWSREALKGWKNYIVVSVTIALTFYLESLCYEILTIMAGNLPKPEDLASHVAMANFSSLFFFIAFGLSIVMQNFVGNAMGSGNPNKAYILTKIGVMLNGILCVFLFAFMIIFRGFLARFFTEEEDVVEILVDLIKIYAILTIADYTQIFFAGVMKGIGKEHQALQMYMIVYYIIGIPICYVMAFIFGLRIIGLWIGWAITLYLIAIVLGICIYRTDWEIQCNEVRERLLQDQDKNVDDGDIDDNDHKYVEMIEKK